MNPVNFKQKMAVSNISSSSENYVDEIFPELQLI